MSLTTPQNERVHDHRLWVMLYCAQVSQRYERGEDAMREEDMLDDAILAYVKARNSQKPW